MAAFPPQVMGDSLWETVKRVGAFGLQVFPVT